MKEKVFDKGRDLLYNNLKPNIVSSAMMGAIRTGLFETDEPARERNNTISLACFTPYSRETMQEISAAEAEYCADAYLNQTDTHKKRIDTKLTKSYTHHNIQDLLITLRNCSAEYQLLSELKFRDGTKLIQITNEQKPVISRLLDSTFFAMNEQTFRDWYYPKVQQLPYLLTSQLNRVASLMNSFQKAATDYDLVQDVIKENAIPKENNLKKVVDKWAEFIVDIKRMVRNDACEFTTAPRLYAIAHPKPKEKKNKTPEKKKPGDEATIVTDDTQPQKKQGGGPRPTITLFEWVNPSDKCTFGTLKFPKVKIGTRNHYLCAPAHCKGKACTRHQCSFIHIFEPKDGKKWWQVIDKATVAEISDRIALSSKIKWNSAEKPPGTNEVKVEKDKESKISSLTKESEGTKTES